MDPTKLHLALFADGQAERVPPTEFRIFTAGVVSTTKGVFLFDDKAAVAVMAAYQEHGADIPVDYDHLMLDPYAPMGGGKAAGWLKLEMRNGELWAADVRWTPAGADCLKNAEYRYISPAFYTDDEGRMARLINVALTNLPATHGLTPLVAAKQANGSPFAENKSASAKKEETTMRNLLNALGLSDNATEADAIVTLGRRLEAAAQDAKAVAQVLSIVGASTVEEAIGKIAAHRDESAKVGTLSARVNELESGLRRKEVEAIVGEKVALGFLTPANREFAIGLGMDSPKSFDAYLATLTAQVTVDTSGGKDKPAKATGKVKLSKDERDIAAVFGLSAKEFAAKCLSDSDEDVAVDSEEEVAL